MKMTKPKADIAKGKNPRNQKVENRVEREPK